MSLGTPMRMVWEAYHKGVTLLAVPETPTDTIHPPKITAEKEKNKRKDGRSGSQGSFFRKVAKVLGQGFLFVSCYVPISEKTWLPKIQTKTKNGASFCSDI